MKYPEEIAKRIVEAVLPGAEMKPNLIQSHGEYDFDLLYPNGTVAAAEVTTSTDPDLKQIGAEIRSKKKGGPIIEAHNCQKSWMVFPMRDALVSKIRKEADECLSAVELAGITHFSSADAYNHQLFKAPGIEKLVMSPVHRCVEDICTRLGIMSGSTIPDDPPPKIHILNPMAGGAVGPQSATEAGVREAWKEDNQRKLDVAKTAERHLMVYLDAALPLFALTEFEPPSTLPELPAEITHIWLIGHGGTSNDEFVVWRANTQEPWHSQRIVIPHNEHTDS